MTKICTSLEQSKKLVELGIDRNTADMYFNTHQDVCFPIGNSKIDWDLVHYDEAIPAWSLSALLELMPIVNENTYTMRGTLDGGAFISHEELTCVVSQEDNPLDAAFEMVCWLLENKKL